MPSRCFPERLLRHRGVRRSRDRQREVSTGTTGNRSELSRISNDSGERLRRFRTDFQSRAFASYSLVNLQFPQVDSAPFHMGRFSAVDLQSNKSLRSEMSIITILEVRPRYSVEPRLDAPSVTLYHDCIPFLPPEYFFSSQGK